LRRDPGPAESGGAEPRRRGQSRFWLLLSILFGLIAVEGGVGLFVLARLKNSGNHLERVENAGLHIDELGLRLNNYIKEMKVSTGLSQQADATVPLPPTRGLAESARRLREMKAEADFPRVATLLTDVEKLIAQVSAYHQKLAAKALDDAALLYIQSIEPLADQILETDFPSTRAALMSEVENVGRENRDAGMIARRVLVGSLLLTLGVGLFLARLIVRTLDRASRQEKELERRDSEMVIARSIQTSVIPRDFTLPGFDIAAVMMPATEVGGDFYEFRRTADGGAWLGIGDVTGHGISAGLIMMMAQSMFTMLSESSAEEPTPAAFLAKLNRALYFNLRSRLREDKFMTMVVARLLPDGRMVYAGAHTDLLVYRKRTASVERLPTDGLWLGLVEDLAPATRDHEVTLDPGDVALFHTDGVTEAANEKGEFFDISRLIERLGGASGATAGDAVMDILSATRAWCPYPADDVSLMAIKKELT
jgi:serine phosphatase RsbU (regulator of sigma subunit)